MVQRQPFGTFKTITAPEDERRLIEEHVAFARKKVKEPNHWWFRAVVHAELKSHDGWRLKQLQTLRVAYDCIVKSKGIFAMLFVLSTRCGGSSESPICPTNQVTCDGRCVDPSTSRDNCGLCGRVCAAGMSCSAGECSLECGGGTTRCGDRCNDVKVDITNCGACGATCRTGQLCEAGHCMFPQCGVGQERCDDGTVSFCTHLASDPSNCGACGKLCGLDEHCDLAMCVCDTGFARCGSACVDLQTDLGSCGSCGVVCNGKCANGYCTADLVKNQNGCQAIAADNQYVYWTNETDKTVMKVSVNGGNPMQLATTPAASLSIVVDSANLYYPTYQASGTINALALTGGSPVALASGVNYPWTIAQDATTVFWVSSDGKISSVPKSGGSTTVIATAQYDPRGIAVDSYYVYWTTWDGYLRRAPKSGGSSIQLGFSANNIAATLGIDATYAYWYAGDLLRTPLTGGGSVPLISGGDARALLVDGGDLYLVGQSGLSLLHLKGGPPTTLDSWNSLSGVATNATAVFWTSYQQGTIRKRSPK